MAGTPSSSRGVSSGVIIASGKQTADVGTAGTTFGTGADILTAALSITADGTSSYLVQCIGPGVKCTVTANVSQILNLDAAQSNQMLFATVASGTTQTPFVGATVITPGAGAHTINVRMITGGGTATAYSGTTFAGASIAVTVTRL